MSVVISDSNSGEESYWLPANNKGDVAGGLNISDGGNDLGNGTISITTGFETGDEIKLPSAIDTTPVQYTLSIPYNSTKWRYLGTMESNGGMYTQAFSLYYDFVDTAVFGHQDSRSLYAVMNLATNALPSNVTIASATWSFTITTIAGANTDEQIHFYSLDSGSNGSQTFTTPTTLLGAVNNPQVSGSFTIEFSGSALVTALQNFVNNPSGFPGFLMRFAELRTVGPAVPNAPMGVVATTAREPEDLFDNWPSTSSVLTVTISAASSYASQALTMWSGQNALNWTATFNSAYYTNTSGNPATWPKTINFSVGNATTNTYNSTFSRTMNRQLPVVSSMETDPIIFYKDYTQITISQTVVISDIDTNVQAVEVTLAPFFILEDTLELENTAFTTTFSEGVLLISNIDTPAAHQTALRKVTYTNHSTQRTTTERTLSVRVQDIDDQWSNTVSRKLMMSSELSPTSASDTAAAAAASAADATGAERGVTHGEMALILGGIIVFMVLVAIILVVLKRKGKI